VRDESNSIGMGSMCASCTEILKFHREHPCVEIGPSFYLMKGTNRPKETFVGCAGRIEYHRDGINVCLVYTENVTFIARV
jgi:hypothetical protein